MGGHDNIFQPANGKEHRPVCKLSAYSAVFLWSRSPGTDTKTQRRHRQGLQMFMTDLEEAWELALAEASQRAQKAGRADIARYLDLRRRNDLLRSTAIDWLNAVMTSLAGDANRSHAGIQIERHESHRFRR